MQNDANILSRLFFLVHMIAPKLGWANKISTCVDKPKNIYNLNLKFRVWTKHQGPYVSKIFLCAFLDLDIDTIVYYKQKKELQLAIEVIRFAQSLTIESGGKWEVAF
jgi:hypothetical protein